MSFLGGLTSNISNLLNFIQDGFAIVDTESNTVYKFDTYTSYSMTKQNQVPFQPIEAGSFAVDSKIISPRKIAVTARKAVSILSDIAQLNFLPNFITSSNMSVASFKAGLLALADSPSIVNLIINNKIASYSENYTYYTLESISWQTSPDELGLVADMSFSEVRLNQVSFGTVPNPLNAVDTAQSNNGITSTQQPTPAMTNALLQPTDPNTYFNKYL